jgi:hypothetical protein
MIKEMDSVDTFCLMSVHGVVDIYVSHFILEAVHIYHVRSSHL